MNLMQCSNQWRSRPNDERFVSLPALHEAVTGWNQASQAKVVSIRDYRVAPMADGAATPSQTSNGLALIGPMGVPAIPTHWAFGQLAAKAKAPGGYLTGLPAPLAADCLNWGLRANQDGEDVKLLLRRESLDSTGTGDASAPGKAIISLNAVTSPGYGRIWNRQITGALMERFGDGRTGQFRIPGEFGKAVDITKQNTTLYASDRDMFVFLANEENRITIPNRRDGKSGDLARGFFVWNSEVGARTFGVAFFLFDYACSNRIVWGAQDYREISFRHTSGAPDRFIHEAAPQLERFADDATGPVIAMIEDARRHEVDNVAEFLAGRFSKSESAAVIAAFDADEHKPMENLWDVATGITAYARSIPYQDRRVELEKAAGKILALAA